MIWITGGGGFLGRELARQRPDAVATTRAEVDLLNFDAVRRFVRDRGVDTIIHSGAHVGGLGFQLANAGSVAVHNTRMGINVLEALAERGGHFVLVSTACIYPEDAPIPTPEDSVNTGPPAPSVAAYGHSKRMVHAAAEALAKEGRLTFATMVPSNIYGAGDHFDEAKSHVASGLIRRAIETVRRGEPEFKIWGTGRATRDFIHVRDAARAVLLGLKPEAHGELWNVGSGREMPIREMAELILELVGFQGTTTWDTTKPDGTLRKTLDISKIQRGLGFEPSVSLADGLRETITWAQEHLANGHN
ncbi:MAG: NAD-dependent epimerase/dehydratase family protein [Chthonomonas sp.]|nr:NAD-dependent epimerase/dehydratase family protein [Chthonomonas sp.]